MAEVTADRLWLARLVSADVVAFLLGLVLVGPFVDGVSAFTVGCLCATALNLVVTVWYMR